MGHLAQLLFHRFDVNELSDRGLLSKWRAKINAPSDLGKEIVAQHLKRLGIQAAVYETDWPDCYWIDYPVQYPAWVSIIIATRNSGQALQRCLLSLFQHTHYEQYEIIVVDNDSDNLATLHYLETLMTDKRIHVLRYALEGNAAQLNNFAAQHAKGEYLLFLNDDAELIQAEWLRRLVALIQRDDVGIVGARVLDADHKVLHAGLILGIGMVGIAGQINQGLAKHDAGYLARNQVTHTLSAVSDACMMIDRALYETVGGMAEDGVLFNDVDFRLDATSDADSAWFREFGTSSWACDSKNAGGK